MVSAAVQAFNIEFLQDHCSANIDQKQLKESTGMVLCPSGGYGPNLSRLQLTYLT